MEVVEAFLKLAETVAVLRSLDHVLETVAAMALQLLGVTRCGLFLYDPRSGVLVPTKAWGLPEELTPEFLALRGAPVIPAVVEAVESREPVVVTPDALDTWLPPRLTRALDIRAVLVIPLVSGGRLMGTMSLDTPGVARGFTAEQIAIARGIAAHAAVAIDNARLYEEARRAVEELRAAQSELVRRETLRATVEFSTGIAHHLNNLLAVVVARGQLLLVDVQAPEIRRPLQLIEKAALDAAEVMRRLGGFHQVHAESEMRAVDLNGLVQETLGMTRALWAAQARERGVRIEASLEPDAIPMVLGHPAALREAILNLLLNAGEALPDGGVITVRTWASEGWVHCAVSDAGVGMSEAVRRRAFEPFFTTKGPKGTGLGLSLAYGVLQRHRGELVLESEEGRGTTVTMHLPAASGSEAASGEAETPRPAGDRTGG